MELLGLVLLLVIVFWFVGFFKSAKRLANIANRGATSLETEQLKILKAKYSVEEMAELKSFANEFDAL